MKKVIVIAVVGLMSASFVLKQKAYLLYDSATQKESSIKQIVKGMEDVDVLFFGEEHDDSLGHTLQLELLQRLSKTYKGNIVLSMEMFHRDVQPIMNEYLDGLITQKYFESDSRKWNNYEDYRPLVEFCKENGIDIICANAPFRYANLVANKGLDTLMMISEESKKALAPLPYVQASERYRTKLEELLGEHAKNGKTGYDLIRGQSLWNATMAYSIAEYRSEHPFTKVLHLNGKLHSDEHLGIVEQLKNYESGMTSKVLTTVSDYQDYEKIDFKKDSLLADYVLYRKGK